MTKISSKASTFRTSLAELERITTALEADDIDLDAAIAYFESGSELAASLQKQLLVAEQKIKKIKNQFDTIDPVTEDRTIDQ